MANIGYIYKTTNLINGKIYIGQHQRQELDVKYFGSGIAIQNALKKHGKENFKVEVIEWYDSIDKMNEAEIKFIDAFNSTNPKIGYNICLGGWGVRGMKPSAYNIQRSKEVNTGKVVSEETRKKLSLSLMGKPGTRTGMKTSEETKRKISESQKGKVITDEMRKNMSISHIGIQYGPMSEEQKEKLRQINIGKKRSPETCKKISESKKGKVPWNKGMKMSEEFCKKVSEASTCRGKPSWNKGISPSEETRKKISESSPCKGKSPWNKGIEMPDSMKEKMSKINKERYESGESGLYKFNMARKTTQIEEEIVDYA